jgi:hypothetical protein
VNYFLGSFRMLWITIVNPTPVIGLSIVMTKSYVIRTGHIVFGRFLWSRTSHVGHPVRDIRLNVVPTYTLVHHMGLKEGTCTQTLRAYMKTGFLEIPMSRMQCVLYMCTGVWLYTRIYETILDRYLIYISLYKIIP